ncbi:hypothetical protein LCGC14_2029860, partial [marine sediment metagenome]
MTRPRQTDNAMTDETNILLAHGGGGRLTSDLIEKTILSRFKNDTLGQLTDAACIDTGSSQILFTTDSYVVQPLEFPGGDIGKLAVCGTVNDLAVGGAKPLYLSCGVVVEEGVAIDTLREIAGSMALQEAVRRAQPIILEPVMAVEVVTPEGFLGEVIGDLSRRRGK